MKKLRKNEEISASQVRLVGSNGDQLGIFPLYQALQKAREEEMDLVEISPTATPPVCKIINFGSFLYEKKKQEKAQKVAGKAHEAKELKFSIRISDNDFGVRAKKAKEFLEKGHPVRFILQFKGREQSHADIGLKRFEEMTAFLEEIAKQEFLPKTQGRSMVTEYRPLPKKK